MNPQTVSVIIPCYNAAATLGETLDSVLSQTWRALDVVVVDDASTDGSAGIVERYADRGVRLVRQANAGAGSARNRGFRESRGDFIQFLDADDLLDSDKIERQVERLVENPTFVATAEWGRFWNNAADVEFAPEPNWEDLPPVEWLVRSRRDGLGMLFPALWLAPRAVVEAAGPWEETLSLGDDGEYFTRIVLASAGVLFCKGARARYRSGSPASLSGQRSRAHYDSQFRVIDLCEFHVRAREDSDRVRRGFALSWQHMAHACYPYAPDLAEEAIARAKRLDDVRIWPGGGVGFKLISRLVGWRTARRLQVASGRP